MLGGYYRGYNLFVFLTLPPYYQQRYYSGQMPQRQSNFSSGHQVRESEASMACILELHKSLPVVWVPNLEDHHLIFFL